MMHSGYESFAAVPPRSRKSDPGLAGSAGVRHSADAGLLMELLAEAEDIVDMGIPAYQDFVQPGPGQKHTLAAPTGVGKTAIAIALSVALAKAGHRVLSYQLEQSRKEMLGRIYSYLSGIPRGKFSARQQEVIAKAEQVNSWMRSEALTIACVTELDLPTLYADIHRTKATVVILDYVQAMTPPQARQRHEEVASITKGLKEIALDTGACLFEMAQLNVRFGARAERLEPTVRDVSESQWIGRVADSVLLVDSTDDHAEARKSLRCIVAKNRSGPTGRFWMDMDGPTGRFQKSCEE